MVPLRDDHAIQVGDIRGNVRDVEMRLGWQDQPGLGKDESGRRDEFVAVPTGYVDGDVVIFVALDSAR